MWLVCHLVDRPLAFRELHRVLGRDGRLVVVTFDPAHFGEFWLNRYFPSIEVIDRARFPDADELGEELVDAGFDSVALTAAFAAGRDHAGAARSSASSSVTSRRSTSWSRTSSSEAPCRR